MNPALFLGIAALTVASALTVVLHRNPVHSAVALVGTLFLQAVIFLGLDAQLIAFLQVIVYAGAVVVLFLFVIMLLNLQRETQAIGAPALVLAALVGGGTLGALIIRGVARGDAVAPAVPSTFGETAGVGELLFTTYLLPFELTSLLLLVAVVGAVAIAKRRA